MSDTVIIDWAGTITVPMHDMVLSAAVELGLTQDDLATAFGALSEYLLSDDSPIHQAERGEIDDDELAVFLEEHAPGSSRLLLDPTGPSILNAADRPEMILLLEDLRNADITVVLATNNFRTAQELLATRYLDSGLVSAVVNSALIGVRKPDEFFYQVALEAAGVDAIDALFVDDQELNLVPARQLGMQTVLVETDAAPAIATIRQIFVD